MIDVRLVDPEKTPTPTSTPETSEDESDDPDDPGMTEIRYVPDNSAKLQDMFKAMSDCQVCYKFDIPTLYLFSTTFTLIIFLKQDIIT